MADATTSRRSPVAQALRGVFANAGIRRIEFAWTVGIAADWAYLVVLLVVAYRAGGALGVGVLGVVRMLPMILLGPLATGVIAQRRSERALAAVHLSRAFATLGTAVVLGLGAPVWVTFLLAAIVTGAGSLVRPIQSSLMPSLARTPGELVASNVASSTGEGVGTLVGPLTGGLVEVLAGPAWACAVVAMLAFGATAALGRMHWARGIHGSSRGPDTVGLGLGAGFRALAAHRGAAAVVLDFFGQTLVRGLLTTLIVVASIELLGLGDGGIGLLNAAIGAGGFAGALVALSLAGSRRLAPAFAIALTFWSLPIALVGGLPLAVVALGALFVTGISNAVLDVAGFTLLQRNTTSAGRLGVFGLLEGLVGVGVAAGGLIAPVLLGALGPRGALIATGLILPGFAAATWPWISRTSHDTGPPEELVSLLRGVPLFGPLGLTAIERLAAEARPVRFASGEVLMLQGASGDRYIVIESGTVDVTKDGTFLRTVGPGEGVGEIALIRKVPRTATVTGVSDVSGYALDASAFLEAVAIPASSNVAALVVAERLAASHEGVQG